MKKAFTFAELMISLVVISVITAILYPTIADLGVNENEALFKSAYRSMSIALSEVINDTPNGIVPNDLCTKMAEKLNVREQDCANNYFKTANGMRWFVPNATGCPVNPNNCTPNIIIDVAQSNNSVEGDAGFQTDIDITGGVAAGGGPGGADPPAGNLTPRNVSNNTTDFVQYLYPNAQDPQGIVGALADNANNKTVDTFVFCINHSGQVVGMDNAASAHLEGTEYVKP